ncbi:glycosyltransferase family A protein [Pseudarthrobacter equi]|uniref:glycosyltransferase family 2 protein n=1 Tax=Pseudarthrobacter equi TaxID=728066 RepID=UPI0028D3BC36|nr:glycosyltransferase family A protein [Pseudarthrobacter equi]
MNNSDNFAVTSVVVPTVGRPELHRAVQSVASQGVPTEIIIVLDDPQQHAEVHSLLSAFDVEVFLTSGFQGGAVARNIGLHAATGDFVAYLDDDDWWEPGKLAKQLAAIRSSASPSKTVSLTSTRFLRADNTIEVLPKKPWDRQQPIADYLVCRPELHFGTGFMQTSSIVAPRDFMIKYPWDESLGKHQDWDLFVRIFSGSESAEIAFVDEELVNVPQASTGSVSKKADWRSSRQWYEKHRSLLSPKGAGDFLATQILRASLNKRDLEGLGFFITQLRAARPHPAALVVGFAGLLGK